jgi:UDP-glucuronate 4-epimerase
MTTNANGTLNLLELMKKYSIKKFVLASSSSLYAGEEPPFHEELNVNNPISPYAASKKAAEMLAHSYHHLYDFDISVLRYFTVYGAAGRPDMSYFRFIKNIMEGKEIEIYGDGKQKRDFTYVEDIAQGTVAALQPVGYEVINLGGGMVPVSIHYMLRLIEHILEKKAILKYKDFHNADMKLTSASIEKAQKILNWKPKTEFEDGVMNTCNWFRENEEFVRKIKI